MNKKFNIKNVLALIAVIVIWGYVMKTKFGFFSSDTNDTIVSVKDTYFLPKTYAKDTFELSLTTKDPFLGGKSYTAAVNYLPKQSANTNGGYRPTKLFPTNVIKTTVWPKISYYGYVKNRTKGKQACLIQINTRTNKMFLGDKKNDITLTAIFKDSVIVQFGKEIKTIKKN